MKVIHIADSAIGMTGGMSRIVWHWRSAFERRGHDFRHFGTQEVGNVPHTRHFPKAALRFYSKQHEKGDILLVHEPTAGSFVRRGLKTIVVSHGLERRSWEIHNHGSSPDLPKPTLKSRLIFPLWRLRGCDLGLRHATGALLSNQDDKTFALARYGIKEANILVFKNGANLTPSLQSASLENTKNILFVGTWLARKGIHTLARAGRILHDRGVELHWVLAGTAASSEQVFQIWPECLHARTEVIPKFSEQEESGLHQRCNLFVLPSFFEGQPLALAQAMAYGRCCITTDNCGQKDIIQHRANGLLFEPGDACALAQLIEECSGNLPFQVELGTNARRSVQDKSWNIVADEVVDFVEQIYAKGNTAAA